MTAVSADDLIRFATELTGRLPGAFAALADGELDYVKARTIWHGTAQVGDEVAAAIEAEVLPRAPGQSTGEIRAKIRRLVKRLDPDALAQRRARAVAQRDLQLVDTDDGTSHLSGVDLPTGAASAAFNRVNAIATGLKSDGDRRGIGQLRADVYLALLSGTLKPATPPTDGTRCLPADGTHLSLADGTQCPPVDCAHSSLADPGHQSSADPADRPCAVRYPGPTGSPAGREDGWTGVDDAVADVIAQVARDQLAGLRGDLPGRHRGLPALVAQAADRIAASLIDLKTGWCTPAPGHGHKNDREHGHNGYRVPAVMRRLVEHRDRRCCFPGCRRPVRRCDADHSIPHHRGGPTCPCNLAMLCRHHHRVKQTPGWRLEQLWPGVLLWITPNGHWRITAPADRE